MYYPYVKDIPNSYQPSPNSSDYYLLNSKHFTSQRWITVNPLLVSLKSISRQGDTMTLDIINHSPSHFARLHFLKETIPTWVTITNSNHSHLDDVVTPSTKIRYNFENDHMKSTMR